MFLTEVNKLSSQELFAAHYSTQNQLTSNEVYDIVQDESGLILFATDNGVYQFDGFEFKYLETSIPSTILHFEKDSNGKIWSYSTDGSLFFFNGMEIIPFWLNNKIQQKFNITNFPIDLQIQNDTVYFSDRGRGVLKIDLIGSKIFYSDKKYSEKVFKNKSPRFITQLNSKTLLFHLFPKTKVKELDEKIGNLDFQYCNKTIHLDENLGRLPFFRQINIKKNSWYFTFYKWLFKIDNNKLELLFKLPQEALTLTEYNNGLLIGLNRKKGMIFFNPQTKKINNILLNGLTVSDILIDKDDCLWISTLESGVYHLTSLNSLMLFHNTNNIQSGVMDFYNTKDDEIIVLKTNNEVTILNKDKVKNSFQLKSKCILRWIDKIGNKVLLGGENPCEMFEINYEKNDKIHFSKKFYAKTFIPINDSISAIKIFNKNHFNIRNRDINTAIEKMSYKRFDYIYSPNDTTYLVNAEGFFVKPINSKEIIKLDVDSTLLKFRITSMLKIDSIFLIGTKANGVYVCSNSLNNSTTLENSNNETGLNKINDISKFQNLIFISSNKGISIYQLTNGEFKFKSVITHPDTKTNWNVFKTIANDSILWANTSKGLLVLKNYNDQHIRSSIHLNPTISIQDTTIKIADETKIIEVLKGRQITIEMNPIALNNHLPITYLYKLGQDDWKQTSSPFININNLSSGNTKIRFKAKNKLFETITHEIEIIIKKNWYESLLFQICIGLLIILLTFLTTKKIITYRHNIRLKKEQKKIEELTLKLKSLRAQMNPHFMFNALNSIMYFVLDNQQNQAAKYLSKFSKLIRLTLQFSEEQEISISDEIEMISLYLDLEQTRLEESFSYVINIDKNLSIQNMYIPSMILQPILENSVWHGVMHLKDRKGIIQINLEIQSDLLNIEIIDNGIGRKASSKMKPPQSFKRSMGMDISTKRVQLYEEIKGFELKIEYIDLVDESGNENGTKVILQLPITHKK